MEKKFSWNALKNALLLAERQIGFEAIVVAIESGGILDIKRHPNINRYPRQMIYEVLVDDYVYLVPFVETKSEIFLKTIIPSRKATKKHRIE